MTPNPTAPALAEIDGFLQVRLSSPLKEDQKAMTKLGVKHLKLAVEEAGLPIEEFVSKDGLAPYIEKNLKGWSNGYLNHLKDIWRQAMRHLCRKGLLRLDYGRCVVPAEEQKDRHDFERLERGYPEALLTVYPHSVMPPKTARTIEANAKVPDGVKHDFLIVQSNTTELKRDSTRVVYWHLIKQMALDMGIKTVRELGNEEGAEKLMAYFLSRGYRQRSNTVRKIRTIFNTLQAAGVCGNPFKIRHRVGEVMRWAIDFSKLPEVSPKQRFFRIGGKRHIKDNGAMVECWLKPAEVKKIAAFGNPALRHWDGLAPDELEQRFREAQENMIARTVLVTPPRPLELRAMNWRDWSHVEEDETGEVFMLFNNAIEHKRKQRPNRVVPRLFIRELEDLWQLRRAAFAAKGDPDNTESFTVGLQRPGIPMWVHPRTGNRLTAVCLKRALRSALLRMGLKPERSQRATIYWMRKAHQTFARNQGGGFGDKFLAEQAGHSEVVLRKFYDSPDIMARYDHLCTTVFGPLGMATPRPKASGPEGRTPSPSEAAQYIDDTGLARLADELFGVMAEAGAEIGMAAGERDKLVAKAALKAGLLASYQEASATLDVDLRTVERWEERKIIKPVRLNGHRYVLQARVRELSQSLSADEAAKFLGLSGRQVRNLLRDGKIAGAIEKGKVTLIPWASLSAYRAGLA